MAINADILKPRAEAVLRRFYGYNSFRRGQLEIITAVMSRRDVVVLMPTGGGKSLCYQVPAILSEGCAVVVSPLIALMKDQVAALVANGIPAATVNSNMSDAENRTIMEQVYAGRIKLLYISPERLLSEIDRWSSDIKISLFAIDEAHCISQWGHDFRPEYTQLSRIKEKYPAIPVIALTATADRLTRDDIARQLCLVDPYKYVSSFDRPNISIKVMSNPGKRKKMSIISAMIDKYSDDSGIVYCLSRKSAESIDAELRARGYQSTCYHAGLSARRRDEAQRAFINGDVQVICATVAFGMGIDKSNIRWVIHNNLPANIESYYQEIGRAGRDGMPAEALMFYSFADIVTLQNFVNESGQKAINGEKLSRMKAFAEATVCRRRILLSYFSEETTCDCGNCDVCLDPPERIDGILIAQKALSAIVRTKEQVGNTMLIDILRGSSRAELIVKGYDKIKTYGAGRDMSFAQWNNYMSQLLQLGLVEIAYEENNHLKITPLGWKVIRGEEGVNLSKFYYDAPSRKPKVKIASVISPVDMLFGELKVLRAKEAKKEGIPPYMVFSDKTLYEMAQKAPDTMVKFTQIEGVGELKTVKYWRKFVALIRKSKGLPSLPAKGSSYDETLMLYRSNYSIEAIAQIRGLSTKTIYSHIAKLITERQISNFSGLITREQYDRVMEVYKNNKAFMYLILAREMPLGLPGVALAIAEVQKK